MAKKLDKYYLYAGYYELFLSGHELPRPYVFVEEFDSFDDYDDDIFFTQDVIDANSDFMLFNDENWKQFLFEE